MLAGAIKPEEDEDEVQVTDMPSSSNVHQDDDKERTPIVDDSPLPNEDTHVSQAQVDAKAQAVDAPQAHPQVVDRRNSPLFKLTHKISSSRVLQGV
jgi:hypothetical protein